MRGSLSVHSINRFLSDKVNHLSGNFSASTEFTAGELRDMMNTLTEQMVTAANMDPNTIARNLLTQGGFQDGGMWRDPSWWGVNKIQAIKQVRLDTGCGLKEAKDAFEQELPAYLAEVARRSLRDLEAANQRAGYRNGVKLNAYDFRNAITSEPF